MYARPFEDEQERGALEGGSQTDGSEEPEYEFEGYDVEFSTKIVLIPVQPAAR